MTAIIVIAAIAAVLVIWFISVQRKLVNKDELCRNSMSQIGVQQNSRWDAVSALVELTRSYNEHEYNTLRDVIAQRREIVGTSSAEEASAQEDLLGSALSRINLVAEQYPQLKADQTYARTMESINQYENNVRVSRMVFNDAVTAYNRLVRQFPDSIVAGALHFAVKEYLKEPAGKTDMPPICCHSRPPTTSSVVPGRPQFAAVGAILIGTVGSFPDMLPAAAALPNYF